MIALVRVDNRLLHGQILEAWVPRLGAREIVVADDEAARSPLARAVMTLCVPPDLPARVTPLADVDFRGLAAAAHPVLVLVREVEGVVQAHAAGLVPADVRTINLGNVHYCPGRRPISPSVFLSEGELRALRALAADGFAVEARAIPSEHPTGMEEIERRYAAGG